MVEVSLFIILNPNYDVAIARFPLEKGYLLPGKNVTVATPIKAGHKVALRDIAQDAPVKR